MILVAFEDPLCNFESMERSPLVIREARFGAESKVEGSGVGDGVIAGGGE